MIDKFNEIYQSFHVWWDSFTGRFALERSIDDHLDKIYVELSGMLLENGIKPKKELDIYLLYDECLLADLTPSSYFAVFSIKDCFLGYEELISKLKLSFY